MPYFIAPNLTSISQVDQLIADGPIPSHILNSLTSYERLILTKSSIFGRLLHIKVLYGTNPSVDQQFATRRKQYHAQSPVVEQSAPQHEQLAVNSDDTPTPIYRHRHAFEKSLSQISRTHDDCFEGDRVHRFLDLGCSPGGFSNWLLEHNRGAVGLGITLPDGETKVELDLDGTHLTESRYRLVFDNIITLAMQSVSSGANALEAVTKTHDTPNSAEPYDLVIAGAFPTLQFAVSWWYRIQLVLSQVLIAFTNLAQGGSCIIVIKTKPFKWLVELISLLRRSFAGVTASKGSSHLVRSSCYVVCRGFRPSDGLLQETLETLRSALGNLEAIPGEGYSGRPRYTLKDEFSLFDIDEPHSDGDGSQSSSALSSTDDELFQSEHEHVLQLFEPQWLAQYNAIHGSLNKMITNSTPNSMQHSDTGIVASSPTADTESRAPVWKRRLVPLVTDVKLASESSPQSPLTSPLSPLSPRWRPPQRRVSAAAAPASGFIHDWRSRDDSQPKPDGNGINPLFGSSRRRYSIAATSTRISPVSTTRSPADSQSSWRKL